MKQICNVVRHKIYIFSNEDKTGWKSGKRDINKVGKMAKTRIKEVGKVAKK